MDCRNQSVLGSIPSGETEDFEAHKFDSYLAPLAQSAERTTFNRVVVGSSPTRGEERKRQIPEELECVEIFLVVGLTTR